jgi:hypothetical protein
VGDEFALKPGTAFINVNEPLLAKIRGSLRTKKRPRACWKGARWCGKSVGVVRSDVAFRGVAGSYFPHSRRHFGMVFSYLGSNLDLAHNPKVVGSNPAPATNLPASSTAQPLPLFGRLESQAPGPAIPSSIAIRFRLRSQDHSSNTPSFAAASRWTST